MNEILMQREVLIYLLGESLLFILMAIAAYSAAKLLLQWDFNASTPRQYALEKRAYMVMTVIGFAFIVKFAMLPYFAYALDRLSLLIPGAMCTAGVIGANSYGYTLLGLKIAILFVMGSWLIINRLDLRAPDYPYLKLKSALFLLLFAWAVAELYLDIAYFSALSTVKPVSCCSVSFGALNNPLPFGLDTAKTVVLYFLFFALTFIAAITRSAALSWAANLLFLAAAYYAMVYIFGTYVYELPTHQCPFCMLQGEYGYIGYLLWGSLFTGVFFGLNATVVRLLVKRNVTPLYTLSLFFNTLHVLLCSGYVLAYYLKNGVLL